jgi:hypothetical protein
MAMAIFSECVYHPYLEHARAGDRKLATNMLDEAPWHQHLKEFLQSVIQDPDIILGERATYEMATLDGKRFHDPNVMGSILRPATISTAPHLRGCVVAFFRGALEKLPSFTTEFTSGDIEKLTAEERELSFRTHTNDINEGMLGLYRTYDRENPRGSMAIYNSIQMNKLNETEKWRETHLTDSDDTALMNAARNLDRQHLEKQRRCAINEARNEKIAQQRKIEEAKEARETEKRRQIALIDRVYDPSWLHRRSTTLELINDQIKAWRVIDPTLKVPSRAVKAQKITVLEEAMCQWRDTNPDLR